MSRLARIFLFCCAVVCAQTYEIAGTLLRPDGHPAKRVRVAIASTRDRENQTAVLTGENGAFHFANLPAGKFHLSAETASGRVQAFGQRTLSQGFSTAIVAGPGQHNSELVFRLIPLAVLHGRVTDVEGEPAERALVQIFISTFLRGKREVLYFGYRYTDDRGEYRFGNLPDGWYYLAVSGKPWYVDRMRNSTSPLARNGFATLYYPSTQDSRSATPLQLKPGGEATANFSLTPMPAATLLVTPKVAKPGPVVLQLMSDGVGGSQVFAEIASAYGNQPTAIHGLQPGRYTLKARATVGTETSYATQMVVMGNQDQTLQVELTEPPSVSGRLKMEDGSAIPDSTYVELENEVERIHRRQAVAPDGTFHFDSMPPGMYRPLVGTSNMMLPLRTVSLNGTLAKQEIIEIARTGDLQLVSSQSGGEIRGIVYRDDKPVEGVLALLAPVKESANPLDYHAFQTDADGSFEWSALPPGGYVLIIKEDWLDLEYANPAVLRPLMASGRAIRVDTTEIQKVRWDLK